LPISGARSALISSNLQHSEHEPHSRMGVTFYPLGNSPLSAIPGHTRNLWLLRTKRLGRCLRPYRRDARFSGGPDPPAFRTSPGRGYKVPFSVSVLSIADISICSARKSPREGGKEARFVYSRRVPRHSQRGEKTGSIEPLRVRASKYFSCCNIGRMAHIKLHARPFWN
jgi:hypothetical protein